MIVGFFRTNQIYVYAALPLLMLLLRWPVLAVDAPFTPSGQFPFLTDFFAWLTLYPWISLILGIAAVNMQGYVLVEAAAEHRLLPFTSNLTAFVLVLCYSVFQPHAWFSPVIFANYFSVLALRRILDIYHQGRVRDSLFRAGIYISLASLLYLPSVFMMAILFIGLSISRTFQWREYVIPVIALFTPYLFLFLYYYLRSESVIFINYFIEPKTFLDILEYSILNWLPCALMVALLVISFVHLLMTDHLRTVRQNNLYKVIASAIGLGMVLAFLYSRDLMSAAALIWPSASVVLTHCLLSIRRKWLAETLVALFLLVVVLRDIFSSSAM